MAAHTTGCVGTGNRTIGGRKVVASKEPVMDRPPPTLPAMDSDDAQLDGWARAAAGGDQQAFTELVRALHRPVRRYLAARAASVAMVEELLQDTFVAAWEGLVRRQGGSVRSWVVAIAANLLRAELRRRARTRPSDLAALERWLAEDPAAAEADDRAALLARCLERLEPHARWLLERRYVDGLELAELATLTRRTENALAVGLHRLRAALRRCAGEGAG